VENRKVAITGGAGFIGSSLAGELAADNSVVIIDDLSTGRWENIEGLLKGSNVEFFRGSILEPQLLRRVFRGVDFVFHLAAISSVVRSIEEPLVTNGVNITGTLNVLIAARDSAVKKVIFVSSAAVYGDAPVSPQREDMAPDPRSPYALTKLAGEQYCQLFLILSFYLIIYYFLSHVVHGQGAYA